jgi:hypothetical protein
MLGAVHDSTSLKQVKTIVTGLTGPSASMQDPDKTKSLETNINKLSAAISGRTQLQQCLLRMVVYFVNCCP